MPKQYTRTSPIDRFLERVNRTPTCWLWTGKPNSFGYGRFWIEPDAMRAHRAAWVLFVGPIPDGFFVCHTCDVPACVRYDEEGFYEVNGVLRPRRGHLWLGTDADNKADMDAKRRRATGSVVTHDQRGELNGSVKLTREAVLEIRAAYDSGNPKCRILSEKFGVSQATISMVGHRNRWQHL